MPYWDHKEGWSILLPPSLRFYLTASPLLDSPWEYWGAYFPIPLYRVDPRESFFTFQ